MISIGVKSSGNQCLLPQGIQLVETKHESIFHQGNSYISQESSAAKQYLATPAEANRSEEDEDDGFTYS